MADMGAPPQQGAQMMQPPPQLPTMNGSQGPNAGGGMGGQMQPGQLPAGPPQGPGMDGGPQNEDVGGDYDPQEEDQESQMNAILADNNLAKKFRKKKDKEGNLLLETIGTEIVRGFEADQKSRQGWLDRNEEWMKMATLVREQKTFPWPKASNIKYPLLATAAMQFSARAYPALVPSDGNIVKTKLLQQNPDDQKYQAAQRISDHMSYQLLECIPNWEEEMDKLLMTIAITGVAFKKTYHSSIDDCHRSDLVPAEKLCINYHAKTLEQAYRKTELLEYAKNEIQEKWANDEEFLEFDLPEPSKPETRLEKPKLVDIDPPQADKSTPHLFLACHTYWDLDGDGYEEPYIITVHHKTKKVVRIIARWDIEGVKVNPKTKKIIKITPVEYFTAFPFIPNPDGSVYALGFGILLGPLNESCNTLINQLVDSGTINNLQAGFIGKGLRIKIGQGNFQPGEWKVVNATGDDLSKSIFPLPTKEPSPVLLNLLNMLVTSGNQLASIAEIFVGKMPGQNTPATTTQETIQQGMAVFTAIYKRVYRSLALEFKKLFRLNKLDPANSMSEEAELAGIQLQASDYSLPEWVVIPAADPSGDSATVKMSKLQQVSQLVSMGTINTQVLTKRILDANEIPNAQELIAPPQPPQPDPKVQAIQMKAQSDQQKTQATVQAKQADIDIKKQLAQLDAQMQQQKMDFERQKQAMELQGKQMQLQFDQIAQVSKQRMEAQQMQHDQQVAQVKAQQDLHANAAMHQQTLQHSGEAHKQKLTQAKEASKLKPKPKTKE